MRLRHFAKIFPQEIKKEGRRPSYLIISVIVPPPSTMPVSS